MTDQDVLVCGGGIAGPALAYWLHHMGYRPTVVERAPAPRPGGQTVDVRGVARTVVERMGLMDQVRALAVAQRGIAFVDSRGRITARMPTELFGGEGIVSEIEVLRGDLADLLHRATSPSIEYLFDETVTGLVQDEEGVTVTFEREPPRRFRLVVGADGMHSVVRATAFRSSTDVVRPLHCCTAWFTTPADVDLDGWFLMHNAPGGLVASIRPGRLTGEMKAGLTFRSSPQEEACRGVEAQQDLLASRFARAGWEVPRLLRGMRSAPDFVFDSMAQVHLGRWSTGRVALVGDAAWCPTPLTGLGTSLALVGAYVLAGELAAADGDHVAAFDGYERVMRPYVTSAQHLPPGGANGYAPRTALQIRVRAASMRSMARWPLKAIVARQFAKADDIALPDHLTVAARSVTPDPPPGAGRV